MPELAEVILTFQNDLKGFLWKRLESAEAEAEKDREVISRKQLRNELYEDFKKNLSPEMREKMRNLDDAIGNVYAEIELIVFWKGLQDGLRLASSIGTVPRFWEGDQNG